jgi:flagellar biosynthetic protein FlhB
VADAPEQEEKTEDATAKRLGEAREKGQVAFSTELMSATTLVAALLAFLLAGPSLAEATGASVAGGLTRVGDLGAVDLDLEAFAALLRGAVQHILPAILALILPVVGLAVLVGFAQVGGVSLAPKAVQPQPNKLDPIQGAKRMFGVKAWTRTGMAAAKLLVLSATVLLATWKDVLRVGELAGADLGPVLAAVGVLATRATVAGVLAILGLAIFDLWFQRRQFAKEMRMTKKEIKDEHKSTEGDPMVKARIRQIQREVASQRMMDEVPDATVVVTNPTHFAVALRYDRDGPGAPRVVAKGVDEVAQRIRKAARAADVLIHEDPPLARALHRTCQLGDEVPEDLFRAVAGVLAYVYRVQGETSASA